MSEIKFNHQQLQYCKARIDYLAHEFQKYIDEATTLINGFESEKQYWLMQSIKGITASLERLNDMSGKLARLAELYSDCEQTVENIVKRLFVPVPLSPQHVNLYTSVPLLSNYSVSYTTPRDLFVESWIMELIYSEGI